MNALTILTQLFLVLPLLALVVNNLVPRESMRHATIGMSAGVAIAQMLAAIAGFFLFLSGLITGYFNNKAAYGDVGARISRLRWLARLSGKERAQRIGRYIEDHPVSYYTSPSPRDVEESRMPSSA